MKEKSFLSWVGGKSLLAKKIVQMIPPHDAYVEPFCGAAWVFFKKNKSHIEILNDINGDLVNLFRVVRCHEDEFLRQFEYMPISQEEFYRLRALDPSLLTDIQRAARFYYLNKVGYSGKVRWTYGLAYTRKPILCGTGEGTIENIKPVIKACARRLQAAQITNMPYYEIIERTDSKETFFYIDPPYYGATQLYKYKDTGLGEVFDKGDFKRLADILKKIKGKFILSMGEHEVTNKLFGGFNRFDISTKWCLGQKKVKECLFINF